VISRDLTTNLYGQGDPLPVPVAHSHYRRGKPVRSGTRSLSPSLPHPEFDVTDPKTWTYPVLPPYQPRGL
jgi:hypothetical protein